MKKSTVITTMIDLGLLIHMSSLANVSAIGHFGGFMMGLLIGLFYFNIIFNKETKVNPIQENKITEEKSLIIIQ